jgi:TRAP-type uncharacterized transport system substrate-binding protein
MPRTRSLTIVTLIATALAGSLVVSTSEPAQAQRKSIRWAVASVDTYGYKVAASVTKIIEEALGGEYTVTVNPYPSTTAAMKATMEGNGEIGYTADVGMTEYVAGEGAFRNYKPTKGTLVHRWKPSSPCPPRRPRSSSAGRISAAGRCSTRRPAS